MRILKEGAGEGEEGRNDTSLRYKETNFNECTMINLFFAIQLSKIFRASQKIFIVLFNWTSRKRPRTWKLFEFSHFYKPFRNHSQLHARDLSRNRITPSRVSFRSNLSKQNGRKGFEYHTSKVAFVCLFCIDSPIRNGILLILLRSSKLYVPTLPFRQPERIWKI